MRARYALLGQPVRHSPAPALYAAAFDALGVDADYVAMAVTAEELPEVMRRISREGGGNVTLPHKRRAAESVDAPTPAVRRSGACNCFWTARDGSLVGDNTDIGGFLRTVRPLVEGAGTRLEGSRSLVVGAGGAARAVLVGLEEARASAAEVLNRTRGAAEAMLDDIGLTALRTRVLVTAEEAAGPYDLVVNATSLGLKRSDPLPLDLSRLEATVAFDCVYAPRGTAWSRHATAIGMAATDGLGMLVEQARISVRNWVGAEPPPGPMREAALAALSG